MKSGSKTILIVEDEPLIAEAMQLMLNTEGYATVVAGDGSRALDILHKTHVDLILTDLGMSPMHGRDFLAAKLADPVLRSLPTIVVSAEPDVSDLSGVLKVISKPFATDDLLEQVRLVFVDQ